MGCHFITQNLITNKKLLLLHNTSAKRLKSVKKKNNKRALKAQINCSITAEKRFETKLKEVLN
jgi:hypothetical protein